MSFGKYKHDTSRAGSATRQKLEVEEIRDGNKASNQPGQNKKPAYFDRVGASVRPSVNTTMSGSIKNASRSTMIRDGNKYEVLSDDNNNDAVYVDRDDLSSIPPVDASDYGLIEDNTRPAWAATKQAQRAVVTDWHRSCPMPGYRRTKDKENHKKALRLVAKHFAQESER